MYLCVGTWINSPSQAVCTEAGLLALRERRMKVTGEDFKKAKEKVMYRKNQNLPEGLYL
jgi:26S proteasome regulatory subunit T2